MCWTLPPAARPPGCGSGWSASRLPRRSGRAREEIAAATTDAGGRIASLGPEDIAPGTYRLVFDTGGYLATADGSGRARGSGTGSGSAAFFPEVTVTFAVAEDASITTFPS